MFSNKLITFVGRGLKLCSENKIIARSVQVNRCLSSVASMPAKRDKETFNSTLPELLDQITSDKTYSETKEVGEWLRKVIEYNIKGGKKNRGLTTILAYEMLEKPGCITKESLKLAGTLGWCVELLQAHFLILDDIIDKSETRRGVPCWHRLPDVREGAVNDALLVQATIYQTIRANFKGRGLYVDVLDLFNQTLHNTTIGQHLDISTANTARSDYNLFTMDRYKAIVKYKTAYYTYNLPVCLGLFLTNNGAPENLNLVTDLCLDIGMFFQMQDDYIDCYGNPSKTGKAGTDIQERKCSWLAVNALERCNKNQRIVFNTCYGSNEPAHIERIKHLYHELNLPKVYAEVEKASYDSIVKRIEALPPNLERGRSLFKELLNTIYKRNC